MEKPSAPTKNEKQAAVDAIRHAIKRGEMVKPSCLKCIDCGKNANIYHHYNGYSVTNRKVVIPLCYSCHSKRHIL